MIIGTTWLFRGARIRVIAVYQRGVSLRYSGRALTVLCPASTPHIEWAIEAALTSIRPRPPMSAQGAADIYAARRDAGSGSFRATWRRRVWQLRSARRRAAYTRQLEAERARLGRPVPSPTPDRDYYHIFVWSSRYRRCSELQICGLGAADDFAFRVAVRSRSRSLVRVGEWPQIVRGEARTVEVWPIGVNESYFQRSVREQIEAGYSP